MTPPTAALPCPFCAKLPAVEECDDGSTWVSCSDSSMKCPAYGNGAELSVWNIRAPAVQATADAAAREIVAGDLFDPEYRSRVVRNQIQVNIKFSEKEFRDAMLGLAKRTIDTFLETPPAALLAPPRGGLMVAAALSHAITGVVLNHQRLWDDKYDRERVYYPQVAASRPYGRADEEHVKSWSALPVHSTEPLHPILGSVAPLPVLLVDDIYDTGRTLCETYKMLKELGRFQVLGVVTVHSRPYRVFPNMPVVQPLDIPHLSAVHLTSYDGWVEYFWEDYGR